MVAKYLFRREPGDHAAHSTWIGRQEAISTQELWLVLTQIQLSPSRSATYSNMWLTGEPLQDFMDSVI
jgi:hypothetical protein